MIASVKAAPSGPHTRTTQGCFTRRHATRGEVIAMAKHLGATAFVLSCMIGPVWAQGVCVRPQDMTALQTATVQQHFMVAALSCDTADLYNSFVRAYRGDLQKSDEALRGYFLRRDARTGFADYNAFKTKLANVYSVRSTGNLKSFCRNATASIEIALKDKKNLAELVSSQPISIDDTYTSCGDSVPGGAMVARGAADAPALRARVAQTAAPPAAPAIVAAPAAAGANSANQAADDLQSGNVPLSNDNQTVRRSNDQRTYRYGANDNGINGYYDGRGYARTPNSTYGNDGYAVRDPYARSPYANDYYYGWYDQPGSYYRGYYGPNYRAAVPPPRFYRSPWRR
jgi:hypothetical protein